MKLKEYLSHLSNIAKEHPEALDYDVIYARDDEGNYFQPVHFSPGLGNYDNRNREFKTYNPGTPANDDDYVGEVGGCNAVCVN